MAKAVEFRKFKPANSRDDLIQRIEAAPHAHADAILEAYDLLENLHRRGLLAALNGALGAGDTIVNKAVDVVSSKEAVSMLRVALMFCNLLSSVDPEKVHDILSDSGAEAPSLLAIARLANSPDARRGITTGLALLGVFGSAISQSGQK